jgi:hypothetical protein
MRRFLLKLAMFLIPVIIGLFFIEALLRTIPNDYLYKKNQLLNKSNDIKILVLGSSHANYGINPIYFSMEGFNFSNISQSLDLDYELLEKYGKKLPNLKCIVVFVSYFSMFSSLSNGIEHWRAKNYILYYGIKPYNTKISINNYFELLNGTMISNIKRKYEYYIKGMAEQITVTDAGFGLNFSSDFKSDMDKTGYEAALRHTQTDIDVRDNMFNYNKEIINKIIKWCDERAVNIIFLTSPVFHTYRSYLDENQLNLMIDYMNSIVKDHNNVYYYNLMDDDNFEEGHFGDADHLNETGAMKLTILLDEIIKNNISIQK